MTCLLTIGSRNEDIIIDDNMCNDCRYENLDSNDYPCNKCMQWVDGYLDATQYTYKENIDMNTTYNAWGVRLGNVLFTQEDVDMVMVKALEHDNNNNLICDGIPMDIENYRHYQITCGGNYEKHIPDCDPIVINLPILLDGIEKFMIQYPDLYEVHDGRICIDSIDEDKADIILQLGIFGEILCG